MWDQDYQEYPKDTANKKCQVEAGKGIVGCEMHEVYGWAANFHKKPPKPPGLLQQLASLLTKKKEG